MRARIKASAVAGKKQKAMARELVQEELERQGHDLMRRTFKLFCLCLNERYGFGKYRLSGVISAVSELSVQHERDEVFWAHVDKRMEQLEMDFAKEDYEEMET